MPTFCCSKSRLDVSDFAGVLSMWQDLFVDRYEGFLRCDYFSGVFDYQWNIGEEYRSIPELNS